MFQPTENMTATDMLEVSIAALDPIVALLSLVQITGDRTLLDTWGPALQFRPGEQHKTMFTGERPPEDHAEEGAREDDPDDHGTVEPVQQEGGVIEERRVDAVDGRIQPVEAQSGHGFRCESESDRQDEEHDCPHDPVGGQA